MPRSSLSTSTDGVETAAAVSATAEVLAPTVAAVSHSTRTSSSTWWEAASGKRCGDAKEHNSAATTPSPLLESSQLRTPPHRPELISASWPSEAELGADSTSPVSISCGGEGVPPEHHPSPSYLPHPRWKSGGSKLLPNLSLNAAASASTATTTDSVVCNTSGTVINWRGVQSSVLLVPTRRATAARALVGGSSQRYARPESPSPPLLFSQHISSGIHGVGGDCPERATWAVGQHQHQPPARRLAAFTGLGSDSNARVSFGSVTAGGDGTPQQAKPPSTPLQRQQQQRSHSSDMFASATTTAARPLTAAIGPVIRLRPHQRTGSNASLLRGIAYSRLASGDTATSTSRLPPSAIAGAGVASTPGALSVSSTLTEFALAPSGLLAAGRLNTPIGGKAYVRSLTTSPPPRHRSVGSASSLSSMGAFVFSNTSTALTMHHGVLNRATERVPPTFSYSSSHRAGERVDCGAESDAVDVVRGDEGENYPEDGGAGSYKAVKSASRRRQCIDSSCGGERVFNSGTEIEVAIHADTYARSPSRVPHSLHGGGARAVAGFGEGAANNTPDAAQVGDDGVWSGSEDPVTWLSCAASCTASSTSASATYVSSSFGSVRCGAAATQPHSVDVELVRQWRAQQRQRSDHRKGGDHSLRDASADDEKSEDGIAACALYAAAPRRYHCRLASNAPAQYGAAVHGRREKRHHRYVRVHHRRRQPRSLSDSSAAGRDAALGEEQAHVVRLPSASTMDTRSSAATPILSVDPAASVYVSARTHIRYRPQSAVTAPPDMFAANSPHLSTSSLLYYDDVCSDVVDDLYYQIEKRLFPTTSEAERSRRRASRSAPPPPAVAPLPAALAAGDTGEAWRDCLKESPIDALFTVLSVPPRLNLRGGFHPSDYYAPCPVCHPAMRTAAEGADPEVGATASRYSCHRRSCRRPSVCFRSERRLASSPRTISRISGSASLRPAESLPSSVTSANTSTSGLVTGLQHGHVASTCDARRQGQRVAAVEMRVNHSTTAAGAPVSSMLTARVSSPFANGAAEKPPKQSKSRQVCPPEPKAVAGTEDTVRNAKDGRGGTRGSGRAGKGRLPPPLAVTAAHRHSRYRRQRVRHPPAVIAARRRQGYHRRGGVGGGTSHSPCTSFMRQRLLCVRLNDKVTYIDPKSATGAARLLAGAALLAEKTQRREAERGRPNCVTAGEIGGCGATITAAEKDMPLEGSVALSAPQLQQQAPASRCHSNDKPRFCTRDQLPPPVERQRQSSALLHAQAAQGARGGNDSIVPADSGNQNRLHALGQSLTAFGRTLGAHRDADTSGARELQEHSQQPAMQARRRVRELSGAYASTEPASVAEDAMGAVDVPRQPRSDGALS
ncbi:hypothetical protein LSCM4_07627 [Leishmania orientalis]|uniref:Uncharacterized protein n=1 Tax=Leishmania orientalis TaxID=2249476 RepID=A0A836HXV8_9TRYP|nr:hypothetical protein LSCM4_07627 [Leishmania orientalis]